MADSEKEEIRGRILKSHNRLGESMIRYENAWRQAVDKLERFAIAFRNKLNSKEQ